MTATLLGWVATGYLLTMGMFLVPIGRLADIWDGEGFFGGCLSLYPFFLPHSPLQLGRLTDRLPRPSGHWSRHGFWHLAGYPYLCFLCR